MKNKIQFSEYSYQNQNFTTLRVYEHGVAENEECRIYRSKQHKTGNFAIVGVIIYVFFVTIENMKCYKWWCMPV